MQEIYSKEMFYGTAFMCIGVEKQKTKLKIFGHTIVHDVPKLVQ